jgi:hypothetical protein
MRSGVPVCVIVRAIQVCTKFNSAVTNAFFVSLHGLSVGPFPPLDHTRSASQSAPSSRAAIQMAASAAGFRQQLGGGVALRLRSRRHSACASLLPLTDRRPKPIQNQSSYR